MVWAFVTGLCFGLPAGVYLREKGYATKMRNAYQAMNPNEVQYKTDNFEKLDGKKKADKYYRDLKTGMADPKDFERYIYGGNYDRKFYHDDRDAVEDKVRGQIQSWDNDAKDMIEKMNQSRRN